MGRRTDPHWRQRVLSDSKEVLRFGEFELRVASGELKKGGIAVGLQPQPLRVLVFLANRPGELVTRSEIHDSIWGGGFHLELDQALNYCIRRIRAALDDDAKEPRFIETLRRRGYRFVAPVTRSPIARLVADSVGTVVVLPFVDLGEDPHQDYFCDGLTEEMINELGSLRPRGLRVIARTSAMNYKGSSKGIREIGQELGVEHALEGSVRRAGGRVRISAQLVRVSDQTQAWAGSYDTDLGDILSVQREVVRALADKIWPELAPPKTHPEPRRLDPEAYELYLKGRYFWHRRTVTDLWKGVRCFERAIDMVPGYAAAHTGLADVYLTLLDYHELASHKAMKLAKIAVADALRLDPTLAEAHSTLGHLSLHAFDWAAAEGAFHRAIELNPSYAMAHFYLANYLLAMGRFDEAIDEGRRAMALDPVAAIVESNAAFAYYHAGRYEEALESCRRALEMDPNLWAAHYDVGRIHLELGEHQGAIEALEKAVELSGQSQRPLAALGHACAVAGERARAEAILEQLLRRPGGRYVWAYGAAVVLVGLDRLEEGFDWMERAYEELDSGMVFLKVDPRFKGLLTHPRIRSLLRRMRLER